jgi:hypothetical protein
VGERHDGSFEKKTTPGDKAPTRQADNATMFAQCTLRSELRALRVEYALRRALRDALGAPAARSDKHAEPSARRVPGCRVRLRPPPPGAPRPAWTARVTKSAEALYEEATARSVLSGLGAHPRPVQLSVAGAGLPFAETEKGYDAAVDNALMESLHGFVVTPQCEADACGYAAEDAAEEEAGAAAKKQQPLGAREAVRRTVALFAALDRRGLLLNLRPAAFCALVRGVAAGAPPRIVDVALAMRTAPLGRAWDPDADPAAEGRRSVLTNALAVGALVLDDRGRCRHAGKRWGWAADDDAAALAPLREAREAALRRLFPRAEAATTTARQVLAAVFGKGYDEALLDLPAGACDPLSHLAVVRAEPSVVAAVRARPELRVEAEQDTATLRLRALRFAAALLEALAEAAAEAAATTAAAATTRERYANAQRASRGRAALLADVECARAVAAAAGEGAPEAAVAAAALAAMVNVPNRRSVAYASLAR